MVMQTKKQKNDVKLFVKLVIVLLKGWKSSNI